MSLVDQIDAFATRIGLELRTLRTGKADDSAVVHKSGNETVGGVKTLSSPPLVAGGTNAANPIRWDDPSRTNTRDPNAHAAIHGSGGSDPVTPAAIGAAADSAVVHLASAESITGAKSFTTAPVVPVGTDAGHPVRRDDARLGGATSSQRGVVALAGDLSGTADAPTVPALQDYALLGHTHRIPVAVQSATVAAGGTHTTAAGSGSYVDLTVSGSTATVAVPTGGLNRQTIEYMIYASVASTVTFSSSFRLGTGVSSRAISIPVGQVCTAAVKYTTLGGINVWTLVAATVSAT